MSTVEKQATEVVEKTVDIIEENLDKVVPAVTETVTVVKNNPALLVGVGVAGAAAGAAVAYFVTRKYMTTKYESIIESEVAQAKEFYSALSKKDDYETPEAAARKLGVETGLAEAPAKAASDAIRALKNYQPSNDISEEEPKAVVNNIFVNSQPIEDYDFEAEANNRDYSRPYIISQEEFMENEPEHDQNTVTYYEGDDVLVDERDDVIEDTDGTVGDDNLTRFGHGSKDNNIVYIRNEIRDVDFEVVRSRGKYAKEVLGFDDDDLQQPTRRRRGRGDDE